MSFGMDLFQKGGKLHTIVINDNPAIVSNRLDNRIVSNFETRGLPQWRIEREYLMLYRHTNIQKDILSQGAQ